MVFRDTLKSPPNGWRWSWETILEKMNIGEIRYSKDGKRIIRRTYLNELEGLPPTTLWVDLEETGHNRQAKYELKTIFPELVATSLFSTPKPVKLLMKILKLTTKNKDKFTVMDFFAGSGTTLHATMQLNAEDGGSRQCILVTNNENNICEEVTYERNRRVIQGYTNSKGEEVAGLTNNNLRYYNSEFVGREPSLKNKREIVRMATELLCIKEDCYEEKALDLDFISPSDRKNIRFFEEKDKRMVIVYDDLAIESAVELIKSIIGHNQIKENGIKVYVFSPGQYPFTEEFDEVLPYISLCALPDALYKAFMNVLPKKNRPIVPVLEEEAETPNDSIN